MNRLEEVQNKLERVRNWLQGNGLDALLLNSQANFAWLTGGGENYVYVGDAAGEAYLLITSHHAYLLTNNIEMGRCRMKRWLIYPLRRSPGPDPHRGMAGTQGRLAHRHIVPARNQS